MPILITQTKLLTEQSAIQYHYCLGRQNIYHTIYHPIPILLTQTILTMQATIKSHFWLRRQYPRPSNTTAAYADNFIDHTVDHTVDCILRQYRRTYNRPSNTKHGLHRCYYQPRKQLSTTNNVYTDETIDHIIVYPAPTLLAYNAIDHATEHSIPLLLKPAPPSTIQCQY